MLMHKAMLPAMLMPTAWLMLTVMLMLTALHTSMLTPNSMHLMDQPAFRASLYRSSVAFVELPATLVFEAPTVRQITDYIGGRSDDEPSDPIQRTVRHRTPGTLAVALAGTTVRLPQGASCRAHAASLSAAGVWYYKQTPEKRQATKEKLKAKMNAIKEKLKMKASKGKPDFKTTEMADARDEVKA